MTTERKAINELERRLARIEQRFATSVRSAPADRAGASAHSQPNGEGMEPRANTARNRPDAERPSSAVRQNILNTAVRLFSERGYAGTSLRDIVEPLNMTPANVYNHFPNKEAILYHAIKDQAAAVLAGLLEAVAEMRDADAALARAIKVYIHHFVDDRSMSLTLRGQYIWVTDDHRAELMALRDRIEQLFRSLVAACLGVEDIGDPLVFLATTNLLSFANGTSVWFKTDGSLTVDDLVNFAMHTVHGLRDRPRAIAQPSPPVPSTLEDPPAAV